MNYLVVVFFDRHRMWAKTNNKKRHGGEHEPVDMSLLDLSICEFMTL